MPAWTRASPLVAEARRPRGLIDTSVVIDLPSIDPAGLPRELAISAVTLAELAAGPHATDDAVERARRQDRLQRVEAMFEAVPFGVETARAFGRIYALVVVGGTKARGGRAIDLLIAATALAEGLPLYTSNADDFRGVETLVEVIDCSPSIAPG